MTQKGQGGDVTHAPHLEISAPNKTSDDLSRQHFKKTAWLKGTWYEGGVGAVPKAGLKNDSMS